MWLNRWNLYTWLLISDNLPPKKCRLLEIMATLILIGATPPAALYSSRHQPAPSQTHSDSNSILKCFVMAHVKILPV